MRDACTACSRETCRKLRLDPSYPCPCVCHYSATTTPTMTDLMISPEAIDKIEAPEPLTKAGQYICVVCNYMFDDNCVCKCGLKQTVWT